MPRKSIKHKKKTKPQQKKSLKKQVKKTKDKTDKEKTHIGLQAPVFPPPQTPFKTQKMALRKKEEPLKKKPYLWDIEPEKRKIIMWLGVGFVFLVILIIWSFSLKASFRQVSKTKNQTNTKDFTAIKNEIIEQVGSLKDEITWPQPVDDTSENQKAKAPPLSEEELEVLKEKVLEKASNQENTRARKQK